MNSTVAYLKNLIVEADQNSPRESQMSEKGFSLIEILVAIFLAALVLTTFTFSTSMFGSHQKLVDTLDAFERAARFAQNEAVLRNRIIRLAIKLDGESQSFTVQYGPDSDFVLPVQYFTSNDVSELLNDEERSAKLEKVEKAFQNVEEFQEALLLVSPRACNFLILQASSSTLVAKRTQPSLPSEQMRKWLH